MGGGGGGEQLRCLTDATEQIDAVCRMRRLVRAMVPLILYIGHADCGAWRWSS